MMQKKIKKKEVIKYAEFDRLFVLKQYNTIDPIMMPLRFC